MDPQATWDELVEKWQQCEWQEVSLLAESLLEWLGKDGFPPETMRVLCMGTEWNRVVAFAVCRLAIARATSVLGSPNGIPSDVPFTLSCDTCANEGPDSYDEAIDEGWTHVRYTPKGLSENFFGFCPQCQIEESQADEEASSPE